MNQKPRTKFLGYGSDNEKSAPPMAIQKRPSGAKLAGIAALVVAFVICGGRAEA